MSQFLVMEGITKVYDNGIIANDKVYLDAAKGEIHAICGENGAGKSTLMKMLFGAEQPDEGRILINGQEVHIPSPARAIELGIGMVHQHFMLVPSLTVAENVVLGIEPMRGIRFDKNAAIEITRKIGEKYNLIVDPEARVEDISVSLKQKVEIIKALVKGADILILDEPTAVLTPQETTELFEQLANLKSLGHTILFISHKLNEVKELCDRVTIMRHGRTVGVYSASDVSEEDISRLMVGMNVELEISKSAAKPGRTVLSVSHLSAVNDSGRKVLNDVSFTVRAGEILGVAGVEGNGQRELVSMITGFEKGGSGKVFLEGKNLRSMTIKQIRKNGMVHIPEDRMTMGVAKGMTIAENLLSTQLDNPAYTGKLLFKTKAIRNEVIKQIKSYQISCSSDDQTVDMLSGGNIQKVVVARELSGSSELLVCDQPTRGIDVGATEFIRKRLIRMRDEGKAILLISADLNEVMNLSDSLLVMYGGTIAAYFRNTVELTEETLGLYMLGVKHMTHEEIAEAVNDSE